MKAAFTFLLAGAGGGTGITQPGDARCTFFKKVNLSG
jgi:hypothetical protein